jgi:hypothetical protein
MEVKTKAPSVSITNVSSVAFENSLLSYKRALAKVDSFLSCKEFISRNFVDMIMQFIALGNKEFETQVALGTKDFNEVYILHFQLSEQCKSLSILHRDTLLQMQIGGNKLLEGTLEKPTVTQHYEISKSTLESAVQDVLDVIQTERDFIIGLEQKGKSIFSRIKQLQNPWDLYKVQLLALVEQIRQIVDTNKYIEESILQFRELRKFIISSESKIISNATIAQGNILKIHNSLKSVEEGKTVEELILQVNQAIKMADSVDYGHEEFTSLVELKINQLKAITIPMHTAQGILFTRKIDFNSASKKWLDYEILPLFIDLREHQTNVDAFYKHSLLNLKSSLLLGKNGISPDTISSQIHIVNGLLKTLEDNLSTQKSLALAIEKKLERELKVCLVYLQDEFLEISIRSSLSQYKERNGKFLYRAKQLWQKIVTGVFRVYNDKLIIAEENRLEKASKCIKYRMFKEANALYDTLFLNRKFIGDMFLVPRESTKNRMVETIQDWQSGISKSILITGDSLCGKTTFIEQNIATYFHKQVLYLRPNSSITIEGRKFKISNKLVDALGEIKKNRHTSRPLIVIDDLEIWQGGGSSLLDNVRSIIQFIHSESNRVLVIVASSQLMMEHLDHRMPFSNAFTTLLDLSKTSEDEIVKAVLLRHGASHRVLVAQDKQPLTTVQIRKKVHTLSKYFNYNIGEVLQAWAYKTTVIDDNQVMLDEREIEFSDFFTSEEVIILKYVFLNKYISEYILKGFLGNRFTINYDVALKRLTNVKVLLRATEGHLILNPVISADVCKILKYRGTFN